MNNWINIAWNFIEYTESRGTPLAELLFISGILSNSLPFNMLEYLLSLMGYIQD